MLPGGSLQSAVRISTLKARIHAGNSNSTQADADADQQHQRAIPAAVSHLDTIWVRRAMVTVVSVNTAAIRIE